VDGIVGALRYGRGRQEGSAAMATLDQCRAALQQLAERLGGVDADSKRAHALDRTISCHVTDLGVTFSGELRDGHIQSMTTEPAPKAQIRLTTTSDDLIALTDGSLSITTAWTRGRLKIDASMFDLLKIRSLL
jgi:predicted lipid carrier protein YhbT